MFDLERREKIILLILLILLLAGISVRSYQKRMVRVDVKPDSFIYSFPAKDSSEDEFKININESDAAGLMKIKGIGKVLAGRIVEYRSVNGNFRYVEDLKKVKGFGQKLYDKVKDKVSTD